MTAFDCSQTAFYIYLAELCLILKLIWWSETFKCNKCAKKEKSGKGQVLFHNTVNFRISIIRFKWYDLTTSRVSLSTKIIFTDQEHSQRTQKMYLKLEFRYNTKRAVQYLSQAGRLFNVCLVNVIRPLGPWKKESHNEKMLIN